MQSITLVSRENMPVLGLGTWKMVGKECSHSVKKALEMGYVHIDTAMIYRNQKEIGKVLKESGIDRSKIFITSKLWVDSMHHDDVIKECNETLSDLGLDYVDLYLLHWPKKEIPMEETLSAIEELYNQGKFKSFGVSNFTIAHLKEALLKTKVPICVNQVEFHPYLYQKELLEFCKENNIIITAYCPLAHGELINEPTLKKIGEKHNKSASQVSLRWLIQKGTIVVPKASSEKHLKENLEIFDFELSVEEMQEIDGLNKNKRIVEYEGLSEFDRKE